MIKKIKNSLLTKVFLIMTLILMGICFLVYGMLAWYTPRTYSDELNDALHGQTEEFIYKLSGVSFEESGKLFDDFSNNYYVERMELFAEDGREVEIPTEFDGETTWAIQSEAVADNGFWGESLSYDVPVISGKYSFHFFNDTRNYILVVYGSARQVAELKHSFLKVFPLIAIVVGMISFIVSWIFSKLITKPVLKISRISKEMSGLKLEWQLDGKRTDELGILEKSLNNMSNQLRRTLDNLNEANKKLELDIEHEKALEQAQMDFFSAVSHELKTPITIMKGQLEGMLFEVGAYKDHKKYLAKSLETVDALESMVEEILIVSRLESETANLQKESFDCVSIINDYLEETEDLIIRKGLQVQTEYDKPVMIDGNKMLLEKVFANLINNAIKYAPENASIYITLKEVEGNVLFSVENMGTHIPEESIGKIFDAFYRVEQSRNRKTGGSGLGLYIVQKILNQYDTECVVCNTESGVKFSFEI